MSGAPIDVILDVDTGVDDALALLVAARHPGLKLRAVTCVAGNTTLANVVRNTRAVLAVAGAAHVPVGVGAERPLIEPHRDSPFHGDLGIGGIDLGPVPELPDALPAVELMRRQILACPGPVTLVALGPLTNVALLIRVYPAVAARLDRIVFMGGTMGMGLATAVAEFNVWADPEAAAIVVGSGIDVLMYGLDVFFDVTMSRDDISALVASGGPVSRMAASLLQYLLDQTPAEGRVTVPQRTTIGDAGTVCAIIDPAGLTTARYPVHVCLDGSATRGQTIVDRRPRLGEGDLAGAVRTSTIDVAIGVDGGRYRRIALETLLGR